MYDQTIGQEGTTPMMAAQQPDTSQMYARGGRLKRGKMVMAHFNPHELNVLDHLQGKRETCPRSGMRSYAHLDEVLKNPHILNNLFNTVHEEAMHHAHGGRAHEHHGHHDYHNPHLNHLAEEGMHGDTELALIGPHTQMVFDHLLRLTPHPKNGRNPHDGRPQYGFLDSVLGGLGKVFSPVVSGIRKIPGIGNALGDGLDSIGGAIKQYAPSMLGQLAQSGLGALGSRFGGDTGGQIGNMLGGLANNFLSGNATDQQKQTGQEWANKAQDFGNRAFNVGKAAYQGAQGGGGFRGALGAGVQNAGQQLGGGMGGIAQQVGRGIQQGNLGQMAGQFGRNLVGNRTRLMPGMGGPQAQMGPQQYPNQQMQQQGMM